MNLSFSGHEFILHPSGALVWPTQNLVIVSDLHLEKGSHFAKRGFFLPPYDSRDILNRLVKVIDEVNMDRLLILGDCFHDAQGYSRLPEGERDLFDRLRDYHPIWIKGNHDGDFVPEDFEDHELYEVAGIKFRHEAMDNDVGEISGHFHPKADIVFNKERASYRCFVEDGQKLIMPAFGSYTGGMDVSDPVYQNIFKEKPRYYVLGVRRVYLLTDV